MSVVRRRFTVTGAMLAASLPFSSTQIFSTLTRWFSVFVKGATARSVPSLATMMFVPEISLEYWTLQSSSPARSMTVTTMYSVSESTVRSLLEAPVSRTA